MMPLLIIAFNFTVGTACIIFGVNTMSGGLEKMNAHRLRRALAALTGSIPSAFVAGTITTAVVQSSTAVTMITVGLADSGFIQLTQACAIIFGANIGTTITARLMSFSITNFALPLLLTGIITDFTGQRKTVRYAGKTLSGFGFMLVGLDILNSGVLYIRDSSFVFGLFEKYGHNPLAGLFFGIIATALVHSSSATVGITIVLFGKELVGFETAIGIILGDNIGTCITTQIAGIGTNITAQRTAWAHTVYNIIGSIAALVFLKPFSYFVQSVTSLLGQDTSLLIANAHAVFNILSAAVFLPITRQYARFMEFIIPDRKIHDNSNG
jgi:phosphate:Na+ symporter